MLSSLVHGFGISVIAMVTLSACGGTASTESPSSTTTTTESPVVTTTDSVVIDFGQQLIDLVAESNCRANQVSTLMQDLYGRTDGRPTQAEWERVKDPLQAAFVPYATSLRALQESLSRATWPADAQTAIDDLIATVSGYADYAQKISAATTFEEFSAIPQPPQSNASATVRERLGLQPQDVDGIDYCEIAGIAN